jgi:hypothetical protein
LQSIIRAVVTAGRGAPPQAIVQSINQFIPLMNLQSQQQWRQMQADFRERGLEQKGYYQERAAADREASLAERERHAQETEETAKGRLAEEQKRTEQAQKRLEEGARHNTAMEMNWKWRNDQRMLEFQRRMDEAAKKNDIAAQRTILTAWHQYAQDAINQAALRNGMSKKDLDAILENTREHFRAILEGLSKPGAKPASPAAVPTEIPE